MKYSIGISEVHRTFIEIELPEGATRDQITKAAQKWFEENGSDDSYLEYSHTLEPDTWSVCDEKGNFLEE